MRSAYIPRSNAQKKSFVEVGTLKRNNVKQLTLRLTADEYAHVKQLSKSSGLKMEPAIRALVMGVNLYPRPPDEYAEIRRQLAAIGNNINQLAAKANTLGFVDAPQLKKEAERWHKFQADVERTFLRPDKSDMKWQ